MAAQRPTVALCAGKDCRRRAEFAPLRDELSAASQVREIDCVGVCSGPVAVCHVDAARPVVIERVRSAKTRRDVVRLLRTGRTTGRIRERLVTGSKRAKALRRLPRRLLAA